MPKKAIIFYLVVLAVCLLDLFLPHPRAYYSDPVSLLISIGISAAISAGSAGISYLVAKKQKVSPVDRSKQDDIRISTAGYGESVIKGWGRFRCAPIWFWHTPIVHTTVTTSGQSGGKGTPKPPTPDTVDHIYTTSIAGVFHDGVIYGGVKKIWFDAELVFNGDFLTASPSSIDTLKYEAELGTLAGGASVTTQAECSSGRKVTGLGSGGSDTITVSVSTAGVYVLAVHYTSTVSRTFKVSINGAGSVDLVCAASGGAGIVAIQTMTATLAGGNNTIAFANASAACPDLDFISLAPALSLTGGADPRSFTSLVNPSKIAPTDANEMWAFNDERPVFSDAAAGGVTNGGFYSATLARWGQPSIRIYPGSETQPADPAIIADKGVDDAPAYRGFACIVIEGIQLQNGRLPNVTLEVDQGVREARTITSDVYGLVGVGASNLALSDLNGMVLGDDTGFSDGTYSPITWANLVNATQTGSGAITKTSGTNNTWNARADNGSSVSSGTDAALRFTASTGTFLIGFSTTATPGATLPNPYNQVIFGVVLNLNSNPDQETRNAIQMSLGGSNNSSDVGAWAAGDVFQVEIRNNRFAAYQNGVELGGFRIPVPSFPLFPVWMGYATGGGPSAASYATGANIGSVPSVPNGGGLVITSRKAAAEVIQDLQTRFQFDLPEVDGVVKAVRRNAASELTITSADLRAHYDSDDPPAYDALITDIDPLLLPARVDINYLDPSLDYHNNTQSDMRLTGSQYDNQSISLSIIESADNIKKLATTLLYKPDMEGRQFSFTTGPKYMRVHPGTVVTLSLTNAAHVVRITDCKYGLPAGVCEFEGVRQQASLYSPSANGSVGSGYEAPIAAVPGSTQGIFIDGPVVEPESAGDQSQPSLYVGMSRRGSGAWQGAFLYREYPAGSGVYELLTSSDKQAGIGVAEGTLPDATDFTVVDTSSIPIGFYSEVFLSSATEAELNANPKLNLLAFITSLGVEYVQFKTATPAAAPTPYATRYVVANFLRGRSDTDTFAGSHAFGESVVLMDSAVKVIPMLTASIGTALNYKFVSSGQNVEDVPVTAYTWRANALKPRAVDNILLAKDGSEYWLVQFDGHARTSEEPATWAVEVWPDTSRSNPANIKRTLPVTGGTTQGALLVVTTPTDVVGEKGTTTFSTHTDKNNLFGVAGGTSGVTLQIFSESFMRLDFTAKGTINGALPEFVGFFPDGGTGTVTGAIASMPIALKFVTGGGGTVDVQVRAYDVLKSTINYTTTQISNGVRFSILLSGTEYRIYEDYKIGQPPLAVVPAESGGYPFPLRGYIEIIETLDILDITVVQGPTLKTIYSAREQTEDFGSTVATLHLRIYQKGQNPLPDGWPVDLDIQTIGGLILLESGGTDNLLTEASDNLVKE